MNRVMFAAAALAAGLSTFASNAQSQEGKEEAKPRTLAEYFNQGAEQTAEAAVDETKTGSIKADHRIGEARLAGTQGGVEDQADAEAKAEAIADQGKARAAEDHESIGKARLAIATEGAEAKPAAAPEERVAEEQPKPVEKKAAVVKAEKVVKPEVEKTAEPEPKKAAKPEAKKAAKPEAKKVVKAAAGGSAYEVIIAKYASQHGVPVALAKAVVQIESNFKPDARGSAGEVGLMQIKPATARMMGYSGSVKGLYDPETNIRFGMKYLAKAHELGGGDTCGTILRYNAGHAATRMNKISAAYCAKVKRHLDDA